MLLVLVFCAILAIFLTAILLATRVKEDEAQMVARFTGLRAASVAGPNSTAITGLLREATPELNGWMDRGLAFLSEVLQLELLFQQADTPSSAKKLVATSMVMSVVSTFLLTIVLPLPVALLLGGVGASYLPLLYLKLRRKRRLAAFDKAMPDVIEMMSRSLRAGHSLLAAISIVAEQAAEPARTEFSEVFRKQNFGLPLRDALMQMLDRVPSQDLRVLVTGILVQKDTGGNLVQILDRTSAVIRERLKLQGEIRTHTAQGRMTGWILCALPIVMLVLINMVNPGYSKPLTETPLGRKMLYVGGVLFVIGAGLIKRIVSSIEV
jgi:tight adherence protein B